MKKGRGMPEESDNISQFQELVTAAFILFAKLVLKETNDYIWIPLAKLTRPLDNVEFVIV